MKALTYIEAGKIDTIPLITHCYKLVDIEEAYRLFKTSWMGLKLR